MVRLISITLLLISATIGCSVPSIVKKDDDKQRATGVVITHLAFNSAHNSGNKPDDGKPDDGASEICPICDGTGKVGDGVIFATCRTCNGTGKVKPRAAESGPLTLPPAHDVAAEIVDMSVITGVSSAEPKVDETPLPPELPVTPTVDESAKIKELEETQKQILELLNSLKPSVEVITGAIEKSSTKKSK